MNVVTLYFAVWLISDLQAKTTLYAAANSLSSLLVAASIPLLAARSDVRRRRMPWVVGFTLLCCGATALLGFVGAGLAPEAAAASSAPAGTLLLLVALFTLANYAYQGALPFYNAMLPELVPPAEHGRLSGLGTALGYVGSIAGVFLVAPFVAGRLPLAGALSEETMSVLRSAVPFTASGGRAATFVPTALLFLLFSLPLFFLVRDHFPVPRAEWRPIRWREPFAKVVEALRETRRYPGVLRFVVASYFYQDAIGTVIAFMAVYAVVVMGFTEGSEITLFVVLTVPAVAGSYACGLVSDRLGPKRTLMGVLVSWVALLAAMILVPSRVLFWVVGFAIGLVFGGIWTVERPLLLTLIPAAEAGRFFGLLVLSARIAAIFGPLLWAAIVDWVFAPLGAGVAYRVAVASLAAMMLVALWLLRKVPDRWAPASRPSAREAVAL